MNITTALVLGLHGVLLVSTLTDYRVSIDSGYHVSLARWYAEHGTAFWDSVNFESASMLWMATGTEIADAPCAYTLRD